MTCCSGSSSSQSTREDLNILQYFGRGRALPTPDVTACVPPIRETRLDCGSFFRLAAIWMVRPPPNAPPPPNPFAPQGMPGQVPGLVGVGVPPPSPVGPRGTAAAAAAATGATIPGAPAAPGSGGGPTGGVGVPPSPLGGPTAAPLTARKKNPFKIVDPTTGMEVDMSDAGGGGRGGGGGGGLGPPAPGRSPRVGGGAPGTSDVAKEMREKAQAALKGEAIMPPPSPSSASAEASAKRTATAPATFAAGGAGASSPPAFKGAPPSAGAGADARGAGAAPASEAVSTSRSAPAKADSGGAPAVGTPIEVSFGSYSNAAAATSKTTKSAEESAAKDKAEADTKAAAAAASAAAKASSEATAKKEAEAAAAAKAKAKAAEEVRMCCVRSLLVEMAMHGKQAPTLCSLQLPAAASLQPSHYCAVDYMFQFFKKLVMFGRNASNKHIL